MAEKKIKRILNCIPSREVERDWSMDHALAAGLLKKPVAIPKSKDLREPWWKVGNQEDTGSCVGWATADSVIRWHMARAEWIEKATLLSPRFVWMAAKEFDQYNDFPTTFIELEGTSLKAALDIARKFGVVTDKVLPFKPARMYRGDYRAFYATAARLKIASYINLGRNPDDWKTWLAQNGPILTRLEVDETWDNADRTRGNLDMYKPDTARGGHAIALVGYTDKRFIVRNSWGTGWGDKGFAHASYGYAREAFTEAYGVSL